MRRSHGPRRAHAYGLCLAGAAIFLLACVGADAAAIHRHATDTAARPFGAMPAAELSVFREWSRYLLAGPSAWAAVEHPPVTTAVRSAIWQSVRTDPGATDPMVNFLLWKQSIDPTRFAHYHPNLAPVLHRISMARSRSSSSSPVSPVSQAAQAIGPGSGGGTAITPPSPAPGSSTSQDNLIPPSVPEPSMLLLAAGMTAWFVRRHLRHPRGRDESPADLR